MTDRSDASQTTEDYARGYRDGVTAASQTVAEFYRGLQEQDAKIIRDTVSAQAVVQHLILQRLAPLQDGINALRPEMEDQHG